MEGGLKVPCGWSGCPEFFASVADMNRHVQFNHMQYKVEVTVVPFNPSLILPRNPTALLQDVKPSLEPGSALNPLRIEEEDDVEQTFSSSSSLPPLPPPRPPTPVKEPIKEKCPDPSCTREFGSRHAAQRHFHMSHQRPNIGNLTPIEDSLTSESAASTSSIKCQRRGCKRAFASKEEADTHFQMRHLNLRSCEFGDEDGEYDVQEEPKIKRKRGKKKEKKAETTEESTRETVEPPAEVPQTEISLIVGEPVVQEPEQQVEQQNEEQYYTVDDDHCYYNKNIPE